MQLSSITDIVILNDYASVTGGSSAVAFASAEGLAARGFRVTLFTAVGPVSPDLLGVPNLEVICLDQPELIKDPNRLHAMTSGLRNVKAERALRQVLATKDAAHTLVHAHTWMMALSPYVLEAAIALGFPLIVTLHDFFISCPTGSFYEHGAEKICHRTPLSWDCLRCHCDRRNFGHKIWRSARAMIQNRLLGIPSRVTGYVAVSEFSLKIARPHLPPTIPARVVRNPANCIDQGPANPAAHDSFLFIGRFMPEKGVRLFAQAIKATGLPATFVGDGPLMSEIRALCPDARFTGWLSPESVANELRKARALVFPPLWYETLGLVTVEAAAAGLPVVVSDHCAAADFLRDRITCLTFEHGSVESLAQALQNLAAHPGRASQIGRAAYDWYWRDPWTTESHTGQLLTAYETFLVPQNEATNARHPRADRNLSAGARPEPGSDHRRSLTGEPQSPTQTTEVLS